MVESSTAKAAEMAARLDAAHRWAVTGTPLSRGLEDLFGLFFFLRASPLDQRAWWARVCQRPFEDGCPAGAAHLIKIQRCRMQALPKVPRPVMLFISCDQLLHFFFWYLARTHPCALS